MKWLVGFSLTGKLAMREERDKSIQVGYEKLNNEVIKKCAKDKDVLIGAKNPKKFWIGYKNLWAWMHKVA